MPDDVLRGSREGPPARRAPAAPASAPSPPALPDLPGPGASDAEALIDRATRHELGVGFLLQGAQDAVAATFGVHAFVVDDARDRLRRHGGPGRRP